MNGERKHRSQPTKDMVSTEFTTLSPIQYGEARRSSRVEGWPWIKKDRKDQNEREKK